MSRIDPVVLLVLLVFAIPVLVQLRTVAFYLGFEPTVSQSVALGLAVMAVIVCWAYWPERWMPGRSEGPE